MTTSPALDSGYALEAVFFPVQLLITSVLDESGGDRPEHSAGDQAVAWGWDWRWNDRDRFEVGLFFGVQPHETRPEKMEVAVAGVFRVVGDAQTVPVQVFAYAHGPALLFPYIRQVVDDLTSRSPYGRLLLPPTNVAALMTTFDAGEATGAKQPRPVG